MSGAMTNPVRCFWCEPTDEENVYRRTDTGETFALGQAPHGAMYYADWLSARGPDGHCLIVVTPYNAWNVDGGYQLPAPGKWARTGTPPNVSVTPSIGQGQRGDGSWTYHAWLKDGILIPC